MRGFSLVNTPSMVGGCAKRPTKEGHLARVRVAAVFSAMGGHQELWVAGDGAQLSRHTQWQSPHPWSGPEE